MSCLQDVDGFASLAEDMASAPRRWQEWLDLERPEDEPLPGIPGTHNFSAISGLFVRTKHTGRYTCSTYPSTPRLSDTEHDLFHRASK